jgi:hypothetical protein
VQERTVSALLNKPAYKAVSVMRVDWDTHRDGDLVKKLEIPRRSTLVMFSGGKEVGRVVARTDSASIEALFKAAL